MADLKEIGIQTVTLFTVVTKEYPNGHTKFNRPNYESKLAEYETHLIDNGFEASSILRVQKKAYAPAEILAATEEFDTDLLVIGHKRHTLAGEMLMGSVASELIHRAEVPLLLLRIPNKPGKGEVSICRNIKRNILLPIDFSEAADGALQAFDEEELRASAVTVLNVQTMPKQGEPDKLRERVDYLRRIGVNEVKSETRHGNVWIEITEYADKNDISLILMGSEGKGVVEDIFIGSSSLRVARNTSKPLMLIPFRK